MAEYMISNAMVWPSIERDANRRAEVLAWVQANGINPSLVPRSSILRVVDQPDGTQVIAYETYVEGSTGNKVRNKDTGDPEIVAREAAVTVPMPAHWFPREGEKKDD